MANRRAKTSVPAKSRRPRARTRADTPGERPLKIGEAARLLGVEAYVLRFWETQFSFLRPRHASSSHRMYVARDLDLLRLVKRLLHVEGYTIAGAKKHIREIGLDRLSGETQRKPANGAARGSTERPLELQRTLDEIRDDLRSLQKLLEN